MVYQLFMGMRARFALAIVAATVLGLCYFIGWLRRLIFADGEGNEEQAEAAQAGRRRQGGEAAQQAAQAGTKKNQ